MATETTPRGACRRMSLVLVCLGMPCVASAQAPQARVRVVLVGDSTVADDQGWGTGFALCAGDHVQVVNAARGGRSSSSYRQEGHWRSALEPRPDWVLIQFGHNDEPGHPGKENPPETGYRRNLARYVREARAAGARPVLVTPLSRRQWGRGDAPADRIGSSLEAYAAVVRRLAQQMDVPLVDLHARSVEVYQSLGPEGCRMIAPTKPDGRPDGTHLNVAGAMLFGPLVAMDCRSFVPGMEGMFPTSKLMELQAKHPAPSMADQPLPDRASDDRASDDRAPPDRAPRDPSRITVARDGSGDFRTLQEALAAAPRGSGRRTTITLAPGLYMGQVVVPTDLPNVTLVGADRRRTVVSYALTMHDPVPPGVPPQLAGHTLVALADGFQMANLTVRQMAGDHGQAIALRLDGDRAVVCGCDLLGWQDTVRLESGRQYLRGCRIEGRVDYVYGSATAVLDRCHLHTKHDGYVTAASTPADRPWGYVFLDCRLTGTDPGRVLLGRPWRPHASVAFVRCALDSSIRAEGWDNWRNAANEATARYAEYACTGPGADRAGRVAWSRVLTAAEAEPLTPAGVLAGADAWDPAAEADALERLARGGEGL